LICTIVESLSLKIFTFSLGSWLKCWSRVWW